MCKYQITDISINDIVADKGAYEGDDLLSVFEVIETYPQRVWCPPDGMLRIGEIDRVYRPLAKKEWEYSDIRDGDVVELKNGYRAVVFDVLQRHGGAFSRIDLYGGRSAEIEEVEQVYWQVPTFGIIENNTK